MNALLQTAALLVFVVALPAVAQQRVVPEGMVEGPRKVDLGVQAELEVPEGALFADGPATRRVLERSGNLTTGRELGMLLTDEAQVLFQFDPVGHVKDDDKDQLDAAKMLESLRSGQEEANEELSRRGMPQLSIDRWQVKPHYDAATHNLEWGPVVKNLENGRETTNYNVRLLGRRGVMEVTLLSDPPKLDAVLPWFRTVLTRHAFKKGEDYASFMKGDKVAEYGLAALITGGAVAVAAKTGLLSKFWKVIVLGIAALVAALKKLFSRNRPE
jgi:uncharacterized membrane-anchored protein